VRRKLGSVFSKNLGKGVLVAFIISAIALTNLAQPLGLKFHTRPVIKTPRNDGSKTLTQWQRLIDQSVHFSDINSTQKTQLDARNQPGVGLPLNSNCLVNSTSMTPCVFGSSRPGSKLIVVLGDSHGTALLPAILGSFDLKRVRFEVMNHPACQFAMVVDYQWAGDNGSCSEFRKWSRHQVELLKPDLTVIQDVGCCGARGDIEFWHHQFVSALKTVSAVSKEVLVIGSTPHRLEENNPENCVSGDGEISKSCTIQLDDYFHHIEDAQIHGAQEAGASFISLASLVCHKNKCPLFIGDTMMFFNRGHLTNLGAEAITPLLRSEIEALHLLQ